MAVARDAQQGYQQTSLASSKTVSHTCTGSDRLLLVTVMLEVNSRSVSGITYNGVALTKLGDVTFSPGPDMRGEIWYLVAPATGANNVVISIAGGTATFSGGIHSFTGVDQTTPTGAFASNSGTSTAPSLGIASTSGDLVVDALQEGWGSVTVGGGQTLEYDNTSLTFYFTHGSTEPGAPSVTMSWTIVGSAAWQLIGCNVKQVSAGGGTERHQTRHVRQRGAAH